MPRNPNDIRSLSHEDKIGTTASGNLPQYKVGQDLCGVNIDNITEPGVKLSDFRYYHIKCPYSIQAELHLVRNTDLSSPNYFNMEEVPSGQLTGHSDTVGVMIKYNPGARVWGWRCVDDSCSYFQTTGKRYFYR